MKQAFRTLRDLFRRGRLESDMADEIRFHIESRSADLERSGLTPAAARRQARIEFGAIEDYKESCREARGFRVFDELLADVRYAFRTLRRSPGFAILAAVSLALGIGVNLSCFASLYAMALRPFPYPDLSRIITLAETRANAPSENGAVSPANFLDWKRDNRSFESLAAYREWDVNLTGIDHPDHIQAALAGSEFFNVLALRPVLGRVFTAAECEPGRDAVAVLSYGFWRTRMNAARDAVGRVISLSGRKYTVIGVMPDEFSLPLSTELWAPLAFTPAEQAERESRYLAAIGKLRPGVSRAQAAADLDRVAARLEEQHPRTNEKRRVRMIALQDIISRESISFLSVLMFSASFVLLLACVNVGSVQVARTMVRQREVGLRRALGAGRFRIFRQFLTESLILGMIGGVLGLALAAWDLAVMVASLPVVLFRFVPGLRQIGINAEVVVWCILLSVAASILCWLPAALHILRTGKHEDLNQVLKEGGRGSSGTPLRGRMRTVLAVVEVALAFILLIGASLMVGTFQRMAAANLGYDYRNVLSGDIALSGRQYETPARIVSFFDELLRNLQQTPELEAAHVSGQRGAAPSVTVEGRAPSLPGEPRPAIATVSSGYLRTMRLPLVQGRWITEQDGPDTARVVVVTQSVARHYWPKSSPVGERIRLDDKPDAPWLTVVGVVGDMKDWFIGNPNPTAYLPYRQLPQTSMRVHLRSRRDSREMAGALRLAVEAVDRDQVIYDVRTLEDMMSAETSGVRNSARMMTTYAIIAMLLAITGIYSVGSFFVAQRTREIGVRMSMGASRGDILKMVLSQSATMTGIGLLIGVPTAALLTLAMSRVLYNLVSLQPLSFALFVVVLGGAAMLAGYIPAIRAARVDPVVALRDE